MTDQKSNLAASGYNSPTEGVVPVENKSTNYSNFQMPLHVHASEYASEDVVEGLPAYDVGYAGSKPFILNRSVSSSSLEEGVVPDHNSGMVDVSNNQQQLQQHQSAMEVYPTPLVGFDREARVLRYKEKRENRKFEKKIRYASRKAYAETRPRIKGRFAKRTEIDVEADESLISLESSYGVVPTY
ncbi:zinc finger protein CONSTANS-LIKE 5-like [Rutidosis leptorrhynchoides]|uniref:zinc finger protein CONSTANS-LIKE 5-like n=1 Tax=Rutidosis leptorrhynchoides TaxID=125765 RepID=UPI003A993277